MGFDHAAHADLARRLYADVPAGATINAPARFSGTEDEKRANRLTHDFAGNDEGRCWNCDCRAYGIVAEWPCGAEPPRVWLTKEGETA